MKDVESAKKLVCAVVVSIVCLFISINGGMNGRSNALIWLSLFGAYASLIYACVVCRGMAIVMAVVSGLGLVLSLIGGIDSVAIAMYMALLIPAAVATLWHFAKNR